MIEGERECFLRGANWVFKYKKLHFSLKGLKHFCGIVLETEALIANQAVLKLCPTLNVLRRHIFHTYGGLPV